MIVVSDTTPLIALMKIGRLELLRELFGEILIPGGVYRELTENKSFPEEAEQIRNTDYVRIAAVNEDKAVDILRRSTGLDLGESEAIVYADAVKADILLMDEAKGRKVAKSLGLRVMGTVGILLASHESGLIGPVEARNAVFALKQANQRISDALMEEALKRIEQRSENNT